MIDWSIWWSMFLTCAAHLTWTLKTRDEAPWGEVHEHLHRCMLGNWSVCMRPFFVSQRHQSRRHWLYPSCSPVCTWRPMTGITTREHFDAHTGQNITDGLKRRVLHSWVRTTIVLELCRHVGLIDPPGKFPDWHRKLPVLPLKTTVFRAAKKKLIPTAKVSESVPECL